MRRWHAIPVAAVVALAFSVTLFGTAQPVAHSQAPSLGVSLDCDTSDTLIDSACSPGLVSTADVDVWFTNNTGGDVSIANLSFEVVATPQGNFDPDAVNDPLGLNGNPDFDEGGGGVGSSGTWNCSTLGAIPDANLDPGIAVSTLGCFISAGVGPTIATGNSIRLATITYNINTTNGVGDFVLNAVVLGDNDGNELMSCRNVIVVAGACNDAVITIGAGAIATATNTPTSTSTPCVTNCPPTATRTTLKFVTVTHTPAPETATPVAVGTPAPGGSPPPGGPAPTQPGGGTGPTTGGPIRLPDTGDGASGSGWGIVSLLALAAVGAGGLAGGVYYAVATRRTRGG